MTKKLPDAYDLDLPDAPNFISKPPKYTAAEMAKMCEAMLPYWNVQRMKEKPKLPDMSEFKFIDITKRTS